MELLQNIAKYLARFSEEVKILNSNNEFHINIHAESLLMGLLNIVYDLNLVNVNHSESGNYAAIDLLDEDKRVAFQITSTSDIKKTKHTIEKFFSHKRYAVADTLNVYILTDKKNTEQSIIDEKILEEKKKLIANESILTIDDIPISFEVQENLLDKRNIYRYLSVSNDLDKIQKVENFLRKQFDWLEEKNDLTEYHNKLKDFYYEVVMNDENGMTLDQIYVEPSFALHYNTLTKKELEKSTDKRKFYSADHRYKIHEFIDDYLNGHNYLNCITDCRLLLVLGYPGQGKTSFVKRFINEYVKSEQNQHKPVYYFQLRNIRNVREFIEKPLEVLYEEACFQLEATLDKYQFSKSFLLLDGLDELYMRENLKLDDIDKVAKELIMLTEKHRRLNIIMTSRYGYVDDERLIREKLLIIQLAEFSTEDQEKWLSKFVLFHGNTWLTKEKIVVFNQKNGYEYINELIRQPILLHMIASLNHEIDENTNRSSIYSQLFTELINRKYSREGQLEIFKSITKEDLRNFLREIAFSIYQSGEEYITKNALLKLESTKEFLSLFPGRNFISNIKGVMISFYFREVTKDNDQDYEEDKSDYAIEFLHKSLMEYFVAEKIVTTLFQEFLEKKKSNGRYVIDDWKDALKIIYSLFSKRELSDEIKSYILEIVRDKKYLLKEELCDRILIHLNSYLLKDFLFDFNYEVDNDPIKKSMNCFKSLWTFVSNLGLRKNYIANDITSKKLVALLSQIKDISHFDFSYQDLSNSIFNNINFYSCTFYETILDDALFTNIQMYYCDIENSALTQIQCSNFHLNNVLIKKSNFQGALVHNLNLYNSRFLQCTFENVYITEIEISFSRKAQIQDSDTNSVFRDCIFENSEIECDAISIIKDNSFNTEFNNIAIFDLLDPPNDFIKENTSIAQETLSENYKRLII